MNSRSIQLVLFDVDGVLTDGGLYVGPDGEVFKKFNAKDGVAVALLKTHGVQVGVISGKASKALDFRIKQLDFDHSITGCSNKLSALEVLLERIELGFDQVAFVGDDIIDIPVMKKVGISIAPADAHELAIKAAHYVTLSKGGKGVARESAELVLRKSGLSLSDMYLDMLGAHEITQ
jgi:3-deoxy-D-manno-octulosonate 8-phosphate phosphatase (KDO 8-P phosphatase)